MEGEAEEGGGASILREDASAADLAQFRDLAREVQTQLEIRRMSIDDGETDRSELRAAEQRLLAAMQRLFRECTRLGPPSPISYANDETGALVLVCGHDPQHHYDLNGQPLN